MQDKIIGQDEIIEEVERIREEIARRYDFDIDRIFQAAKNRSVERKEKERHQHKEKAKSSA